MLASADDLGVGASNRVHTFIYERGSSILPARSTAYIVA